MKLENLCKEIQLPDDEWFMSKAKLSYIALKTDIPASKIKKKLPKYPFHQVDERSEHDCIVFSLAYERYSYNNYAFLSLAPINIHLCETLEDFVAYVDSYSVGADLSKLWKLI